MYFLLNPVVQRTVNTPIVKQCHAYKTTH